MLLKEFYLQLDDFIINSRHRIDIGIDRLSNHSIAPFNFMPSGIGFFTCIVITILCFLYLLFNAYVFSRTVAIK